MKLQVKITRLPTKTQKRFTSAELATISPGYCPFCKLIGHHKNLDMIGKQNYQEPGVEAELNFEVFELTIIFFKQRYGHRSTSLTPIISAMLCYVML